MTQGAVLERKKNSPSQLNRRQERWLLTAVVLGSSMAFIDGSIVNVALPVIQRSLNSNAAAMQWVVNAYLLCLGALLLLGGAAGDRWGRRRVFAAGVALFGLASALCGLAWDAQSLITARALQGVAGAILVPGSLALIRGGIPDERRGRAIGTWAGASALTTAAGPVLGGWLIDTISWRAIFFINVPIAIFVTIAAISAIPEVRRNPAKGKLDWPGALLAFLGFGAMTWALVATSERGFAQLLVQAGFWGGLALLACFLYREHKAEHPMMPLELFRSRIFSGINAMTFLLYAALAAVLFVLPFPLMQVYGYSATQTGAAYLPFALILGLLSRWAGGLAEKGYAKQALIGGSIVTGLGFALLGVVDLGGSYWTGLFPGMVIIGLGMGIVVAPLTSTVIDAVSEERAGIASGINNSAARLSGLVAVAVFGAVMITTFRNDLQDGLDLPNAPRQDILVQADQLGGLDLPETLSAVQRQQAKSRIEDAMAHAASLAILSCAGLSFGAALLAWITLRRRQST